MSYVQPELTPESAAAKKKGHRADVTLKMIGILVLILLPIVLDNQYYLRVETLICLFAAMSIGWNIVGGYTNQTSLGHAVFFGMGAYTSVLLELKAHVTPWLGIPAGIVVAVILAVLIGWPTFRLSGHYFALATLALLQIANILFTYFNGFTGGSSGLTVPIMNNDPGMFQFASPLVYYYISAAMLVLVLSIARWILHSPLGYRLLAIKGNPDAARLAGVNMMKFKMIALMMSAAIVGMAGGFYGQYTQYIDPNSLFSFSISINMALFAIIGGVEFWWGPIIGALILVPLNQYTSLLLTGQWAPLGEAVYGALLMVVVLLKPRGLAEWLSVGWNRLVRRGTSESA